MRIPSEVYKRPDPLIYAQYYLMSQGLGVTWDNPDIRLETLTAQGKPSGVVVSSSDLTEDTSYAVIARVWNGSVAAPAIGLPVHFSYLSFGIGTTSTAIGTAFVDLPAKGLSGSPAEAFVVWHTPAVAGHYCLQVLLEWADDANPANNLGQENTQVKALNSPRASFSFQVRNSGRARASMRLALDSYTLRDPPACIPRQRPPVSLALSREEVASQRRAALAEQARQLFPIPTDWTVTVTPPDLALSPGAEASVTVDILAPDGFNGSKAINVHGFAGEALVGGVTLIVTGDGH